MSDSFNIGYLSITSLWLEKKEVKKWANLLNNSTKAHQITERRHHFLHLQLTCREATKSMSKKGLIGLTRKNCVMNEFWHPESCQVAWVNHPNVLLMMVETTQMSTSMSEVIGVFNHILWHLHRWNSFRNMWAKPPNVLLRMVETSELSTGISKKIATPEPLLYLPVETPQRWQPASVKRALGCQFVFCSFLLPFYSSLVHQRISSRVSRDAWPFFELASKEEYVSWAG